MIKDIIENSEFKALSTECVKKHLKFILEKNIEFSVFANIKKIEFSPDLPENIKENFGKFTIFTLANYTLSTAKIDDVFLYFEAGFGEENFGCVVKIPLFSIFQIVVDESILYINLSATVEKFHEDLKSNSKNVFLKNAKNSKFQ